MDFPFLNLHILHTTSVANQNRDDSGAPKQVTYGGATRLRLSSQAMTRAKRVDYETTAGGDQITWRAKGGMTTLALKIATDLAAQNGEPLSKPESEALERAIAKGINALVINADKAIKQNKERAKAKAARDKKTNADTPDAAVEAPADDDEDSQETGKKDTLVWLAEHELTALVKKNLVALRGGSTPDDFVNKKGRTTSLSIAAFGRMFAHRPDLQNEAAVQRSHAFTTHAADIEPDYFTAVNDLPLTENGNGAGHLDLNQFGGGVFYWHANIDRAQLWRTWIAPSDETDIRDRLTVFFESLLLALPSGKQATTAPKTSPDAVLAVPATSPIALHQAFEAPIRSDLREGGGFRAPSLQALLETHHKVRAFTPRQFGATAHFASTLDTKPSEHITTESSLDALVDACVEWTVAGRPTEL
jgi:CRISPR system Cascade subunit CasC